MTDSSRSSPTSPTSPGQPEVIARGLLIERGAVLVCRNLDRGHVYLPGGHVDPGETSAQALAREFVEEAALDVRVGECLLVSEVLDGPIHEINLVFHVERDGNEPIESVEPHIGFEWLDLAAVIDAPLLPRSIQAWIAAGGQTDGSRPGYICDHPSP